jgi:hypothetical protein
MVAQDRGRVLGVVGRRGESGAVAVRVGEGGLAETLGTIFRTQNHVGSRHAKRLAEGNADVGVKIWA